MPKKKDPSVTFLNKFGYNVVKLPRVGIEPLDVIGIDDTTQWLGPLSSVWQSSVPAPEPSAPRPAAPSLDLAYKRARKVQFSYTGVTSTVVSPLEAGNYMASGTLNTSNPVVQHYFMQPDSQAFVIVDVLKSNSITVIALDEHGTEVGVDVPSIEGILGANVKVKPGGASNSSITYTGKKPVTFGFIVDEIMFENGKWSLAGAAPSGALAFATAPGGAGAATTSPILLGTGCRVAL